MITHPQPTAPEERLTVPLDVTRAISLLQPWASLIAVGAKRIETRAWPTKYRGPLAIHASYGDTKESRAFAQQPFVEGLLEAHDLTWRDLPRGAIVAVAELTDCIRFTEDNVARIRELAEFEAKLGIGSPAELLLGDFSLGRYGFLLAKVRPLPEPIPAKGALGIWRWKP